MRYMNSCEIDEAARRWQAHPVLGPATATLAALRDAADTCSDGWVYWPKPARAAARLMTLIEGDGTARYGTARYGTARLCDEWRPGNAAAWLASDDAAELAALLKAAQAASAAIAELAAAGGPASGPSRGVR